VDAKCNDNFDCTNPDHCNPTNPTADVNGCVYPPVDAKCNDGFSCTNPDHCDPTDINADLNGCVYPPVDAKCGDGFSCTNPDHCDPTDINADLNGCVYPPVHAKCNDGVTCTNPDICDPTDPTADAAGCVFPPVDAKCDDGVGCTNPDVCDPTNPGADANGCVITPVQAKCPDDSLFCNGDEFCHAVNDCDHTGSPCGGPCDDINDRCLCEAPIVEAVGCRYLRILPQPAGSDVVQAIFITPDCPGAVGRYADPPVAIDIDLDGLVDENIARFVDETAVLEGFRTPPEWGELYAYGEDLVPNTRYIVQGDCGSPGDPGLSESTVVTTHIFGDSVGVYDVVNQEWTPPNGIVNIIDIMSAVENFQHLPSAPHLYRTDMIGISPAGLECVPDQVVGLIFDVIVTVDTFRGISYVDITACPEPCP
jgi:hypothetical protein